MKINASVVITILKRVSIIKTIYFNFKKLPFKQAKCFPFILGKGTVLRDTSGEIIIPDYVKIKLGMVRIGFPSVPFETQNSKGVLSIKGKLIVEGDMEIHTGVKLWVKSTGILEFKGMNIIGANTLFACYNHIYVGYYTGFSWDCQIYDTNFHFFKDAIDGTIYKRRGKVYVGDCVFVGNNVTITKGTNIPNGSVISNCSVVSGSFKKEGENLLLSGHPASIVSRNFTKVKESSIRHSSEENRLASLYE